MSIPTFQQSLPVYTKPVSYSCTHEQIESLQYEWSRPPVDRRGYDGQQKALFVTLMDCIPRFEAHEASLSPNSIDSLCTQVSRSQVVAIFVLTTQPITLPLAHARRVNIQGWSLARSNHKNALWTRLRNIQQYTIRAKKKPRTRTLFSTVYGELWVWNVPVNAV
jgi:hypothetical protein